MKKNILLLSAIAIAMLTGCQSDVIENGLAESDVNGDVKRVTMSVKDFEWDEQTRTTAELTSTGVAFKWAVGDEIGVFPNVGDQVRFPIEEGTGTANATFNGGGWALKSGYTYVAYYPFNKANYDNGKTAIPLNYAGQTQDGNASLANISKCDYIVSKLSAPESGEVNFQFSHLSALVRFRLTVPEIGSFTTLRISTSSKVIPVEENLDLSGDVPVVTTKILGNAVDIALSSVSATVAGDVVTIYALFPSCDLSTETLTATLFNSNKAYSAEFAGKKLESGKAYSYALPLVETSTIPGYALDVLTTNGHEYVDLGLPSGTLWATCNIGADKPEDYGLYFAWGETTGYNDGWNSFSWTSYKWCSNGKDTGITKYTCADGKTSAIWYSGSTFIGDNKTELDLEDDAAHVNWGGDWRMPSMEQIDELINSNYTIKSWTSVNGVHGRLITSKSNRNTLFLPATGYRSDGSFLQADNQGYYWSRSLVSSVSKYAYSLFLTSSYFTWESQNRSMGLSVRPVINIE